MSLLLVPLKWLCLINQLVRKISKFDKGLLFYFLHKVNVSRGPALATKIPGFFKIGLQYTSNNSSVILLIKLDAQLLFASK